MATLELTTATEVGLCPYVTFEDPAQLERRVAVAVTETGATVYDRPSGAALVVGELRYELDRLGWLVALAAQLAEQRHRQAHMLLGRASVEAANVPVRFISSGSGGEETAPI